MIKSIIIAFSTYSRIPMPRVEWNEKSMRYSMCFFPLVGVVIGACQALIFCFLRGWLGLGSAATGAILTATPVLLSGGIHFDGYLDTIDAKSSYKPAEEKLKILKDPHTGAFAIIYGIVYMLLYYGCMQELVADSLECESAAGIFVVAVCYAYSRILSGLSVVTLRKAKKDGTVADAARASDRCVKWVLAVLLAVCMAGLLWIHVWYGLTAIVLGGIVFVYYRHMAYKTFGGITGDLAGYFLQVCELVVLMGVTLVQSAGF